MRDRRTVGAMHITIASKVAQQFFPSKREKKNFHIAKNKIHLDPKNNNKLGKFKLEFPNVHSIISESEKILRGHKWIIELDM